MSISRFQERFLSGGCAKLFLGGMAAVFIGGLLYYGVGGSGKGGHENGPAVVVKVGNVEVPETAINEAIDRQAREFAQRMPGQELDPVQQASIQAGALMQVVDNSLMMYLARQEGVDFSDKSVRDAISKILDQELEMQKMQLQMAGQLKPGATDKDFEALVKKQTGKTVAELKADQMLQIDEALKDPQRKEQLTAAAAQALLLEKLKAKATPTEEELKKGYSSVELKRILFKDENGKSADEQAQAVLADLKGGKLNFNQAVDRFSKDLPQPKKRLSETTLSLPGSMIQTMDEYAGLRDLKEGETSAVLSVPEGKAIYQVVKITPNLPKDFDKEKAKYRDQAATQRAQALLQKEMEKARSGELVKFENPGFEVMYEFAKSFTDPNLFDPQKRAARMRTVYDKASKIAEEGEVGSRQANLVAYAAFDAVYNSASDEEKKKLVPERTALMTKYLQDNESPDLRLQLVNMLQQQKDAAAGEHLQAAAAANNDMESNGQKLYADISAKLQELKKASLVTPDQQKQIEEELTRWRTEKATYEKEKAEDEALRKKEEAEMKAEEERLRKEDQAKAKEEAKPVQPKKK